MTKMKIQYLGDLRTECTHLESGAKITTDAPKDNEGKGMSFSPTDLFAASLATCMVTIMGIAAKKTGIDMNGTTAEIEKEMVFAPMRRIGKIIVRIRCPHLPSPQIREKLEQAAMHCPVHASLHPDVKQEIDFVWGL
jgi:putative redox protein